MKRSKKQSRSFIEPKKIYNLLISDTHFQSLSNVDGLDQYSALEESRRMAYVVKKTIEYATDKDCLVIHILGDIIHGCINKATPCGTMTDQCAAALYILKQAIEKLASKFNKVIVHSVSGNHGRNPIKHEERAIHDKWDSYETIIYNGIKTSLSHIKNIEFNISKNGNYYSCKQYGHKIFATHSDTLLNKVTFSTSYKRANDEINKILVTKDKFDLFLIGHWHAMQYYDFPTCSFIANGSLSPADEFLASLGTFKNQNGQVLFSSTRESIVEDFKYIRVGEAQDKDKSLDAIIKPYSGF